MITALKSITARIRAVFASARFDAELDQEMQSHLDLLEHDHIRRGLSAQQARRAARAEFGGTASLHEQHREQRSFAAIDGLLQDIRYAARRVAHDRWFSAAAIVALALGIGVNAIGFTIVNTAFIKGIQVKRPERLVTPVWQLGSGARRTFSKPEVDDIHAAQSLSALAAYDDDTVNISGDTAFPEQVRAAWITANLFGVLGYQPILGRDFTPADDRPGAARTVLISEKMWRDRFHLATDVLGKTLRINGEQAAIIGVMPPGFRFPELQDIWAPLTPNRPQFEHRRDAQRLDVVGELRSGSTREAAQAELSSVAQRIGSLYSDPRGRVIGIELRSFRDAMIRGKARPMFLIVMGAVSFVLLIACANIANLLLSRSGYRVSEIAVRVTLGATRGRVVRQLLFESLALGIAGGILGLLLAVGGVHLFESALKAVDKPYWLVFAVDYNVVGYVAAICIVTAILFGLAPALQLSKTGALKEGARGSVGSRSARRVSAVLVVTELTLAVALLAGAGLMTRSFFKLYGLELGFPEDHLVTFGMDLFEKDYATPEARLVFAQKLEDAVAAIPGVSNATITTGVPPRDRTERVLEIDRPGSIGTAPRLVSTVAITPRYFATLNAPLRRGRPFDATDGNPGFETALINQQFADQYFPHQDPIGQRIRFATRASQAGQPSEAWRTIVGITPNIRQGSLENGYLSAVAYTPYRQEPDNGAYLLVRSALPLANLSDLVRRRLQAIDPNQPLRPAQTLEQWKASERWAYRVFGSLFAFLAFIALVLSGVGLYAVMAYAVTQRTREIGVRMAVGAQQSQVAWLVLKRGLGQLAIGLTLGTGAALLVGRILSDFLVGIAPSDPATFAVIISLLAVVSMTACLIPTRRASRVDPVVALRAD